MATIVTNFAIILLNETSSWGDDYEVKHAAGEIWTAYLVDLNRPVHMADVRPSYNLTPLYYVTKEQLSDAHDTELRNELGLLTEYTYSRYCSEIDELVANGGGKSYALGEESHEYDDTDDSDEAYSKIEEKVIESECANIRDWDLSSTRNAPSR